MLLKKRKKIFPIAGLSITFCQLCVEGQFDFDAKLFIYIPLPLYPSNSVQQQKTGLAIESLIFSQKFVLEFI